MSESQSPKLHDRHGFCTMYAHSRGYVDTAEKNGDKQFITMGLSGYTPNHKPIYFVKVRGDNQSYKAFDGDNKAIKGSAREAAQRHFMQMVRQTGAVRKLGL